jgi:hypothetical protein
VADEARTAVESERDALLHPDARLTQAEGDAIAGDAKAALGEGALGAKQRPRHRSAALAAQGLLALLVPTAWSWSRPVRCQRSMAHRRWGESPDFRFLQRVVFWLGSFH